MYEKGDKRDGKKIEKALIDMIDNPDWEKICGKDGYAKEFVDSLGNIKSTQIRKFFNHLKILKTKYDSGPISESDVKSELWQIVPQTVYSYKRKVVAKEFSDFIADGVEKITKYSGDEFKKRFDVFLKIFESIVAYSKE